MDETLARLEQLDPQQARVVELRYFGGLSVEETPEAMEISALHDPTNRQAEKTRRASNVARAGCTVVARPVCSSKQ